MYSARISGARFLASDAINRDARDKETEVLNCQNIAHKRSWLVEHSFGNVTVAFCTNTSALRIFIESVGKTSVSRREFGQAFELERAPPRRDVHTSRSKQNPLSRDRRRTLLDIPHNRVLRNDNMDCLTLSGRPRINVVGMTNFHLPLSWKPPTQEIEIGVLSEERWYFSLPQCRDFGFRLSKLSIN